MANGVTSESLLSVSIILCCVSNVILLDYNIKMTAHCCLGFEMIYPRSILRTSSVYSRTSAINI